MFVSASISRVVRLAFRCPHFTGSDTIIDILSSPLITKAITRSLGYLEDVEVAIQVRAVRRGDKFLLCSDGLSNLVDPAELGETVRAMGPQEACRHLVSAACDRGGDDNITTVIARVDEVA